MAEIQQWRRMIPSRSRTPMIEPEDVEHEVAHSTIPMSSSMPSTPRKRLRPKLSSYFAAQAGAVSSLPRIDTSHAIEDPTASDFPSWAVANPFPEPDPDRLIETVMSLLMEAPYTSLPHAHNGHLLRIFEAYRNLQRTVICLQAKFEEEIDGRYADRLGTQHAEKRWEEERQTYKAEVKRLELLIAKGKRGLAEVTKARQDSLIRRRRQAVSPDEDEDEGSDHKETVFEFLEKTKRYEDRAWSSQRATMRQRAPSPSIKMRTLSSKLAKKSSMTSIHADLPFGTPPNLPDIPIIRASFIEDEAMKARAKRLEHQPKVVQPGCSFDSSSTFSCTGDLLPDEVASHIAFGQDDELSDLRQTAIALSRRRGIDVEAIMPKLIELFNEQPQTSKGFQESHRGASVQTPTATTNPLPRTTTRKHPHLMAKASVLFHKLKPQLTLETAQAHGRRFSFEPGDDVEPLSASPEGFVNSALKAKNLRKSVSLSSLSHVARRNTTNQRALSPVQPSPTPSAPSSDSRRASKIPSPSYSAVSLAKPRQEREDSMSSFFTTIRHTEEVALRSSSIASSIYSTHSCKPADPNERFSDPGPDSKTLGATGEKMFGEPRLRRTPAATAAAKAMSLAQARHARGTSDRKSSREKQPRILNNMRSTPGGTIPSSAHATPENDCPVACSVDHVDEALATSQ